MRHQVKLEATAAEPLTDRTIAKLLGGLIGGLCDFCDPSAVRRALRWWADNDEAWKALEQVPKRG